MAAELFIPPSKALDANANPYAGAKWFFYATGTLTPQSVFTTSAIDVAHANPVVADSTGKFANIFFNASLTYRGILKSADESVTLHDIDPISAGTLAQLAATTGSALVGFKMNGASARTQTADAKLKRLPLDLEDYGITSAGSAADNSAALATLLSEQRLTRKRFHVGSSMYAINASISFDLTTYPDDGLIFEGDGWSEGDISRSSGFTAYGLTNPVINLDGPEFHDAPIILRDFAMQGTATLPTAGTSQDGIGGRCNRLVAERLLIRYMGGYGIDLATSFTSETNGNLIFGCFRGGIVFSGAANRVTLFKDILFRNGRDWTTADQANIVLSGTGNTNYSPLILNCDYSYSGIAEWAYGGTLSSLVVAAGVATVTTTVAHGRTTNDHISVRKSNIVNLDTINSKTITVTSTTAFTFTTTAADGTYDSVACPNINIGNHSNGMLMVGTYGATVINGYCEDPQGLAEYLFNCKAVTFTGGFVYHSYMLVEESDDIEISGRYFFGDPAIGRAGLVTREKTQRASINVKSNNTFAGNAEWLREGANSNFYMIDGVRYGTAIPTTGAWKVGETIRIWTAGAGDVAEYVCTDDSPLTFVASGGPLGLKFVSLISPVATADATDLATVITLANDNKAKINEMINKFQTAGLVST